VSQGGVQRQGTDATVRIRHVDAPTRSIAGSVALANPNTGAVTVLAPTASLIWQLLDTWQSLDDLDRGLAAAYPNVPTAERVAARAAILASFDSEGLLERR
jgi:hypothetical protein